MAIVVNDLKDRKARKILDRIIYNTIVNDMSSKNYFRFHVKMPLWKTIKENLRYKYEMIFKNMYRQVLLNTDFIIEKVVDKDTFTCILKAKTREGKLSGKLRVLATPRLDYKKEKQDYIKSNIKEGTEVLVENELYYYDDGSYIKNTLNLKLFTIFTKLFILKRPTIDYIMKLKSAANLKNKKADRMDDFCNLYLADAPNYYRTKKMVIDGEKHLVYDGFGFFSIKKNIQVK